MITSNLAFYPCVSVEETEKFYTQVIGLKTVFSTDNVRILQAGGGYYGFVAYGDQTIDPGKLCLSLNCGSDREVDEEYQRVLGLGVQPDHPPARHPAQPVYSFFLRDPNGYLVEFQKLIGVTL